MDDYNNNNNNNSNKEIKKQNAIKSKNKDNIKSAVLKSLLLIGIIENSNNNDIEIITKVNSLSLQQSIIIISVDIPYELIRSINTIIMARKEINNKKNDFNNLLLFENNKIYRKQIKILFEEICSYSKYYTWYNSNNNSNNSNSNNNNNNNNNDKILNNIYIFSIIDEEIDQLLYNPIVFEKMKLIWFILAIIIILYLIKFIFIVIIIFNIIMENNLNAKINIYLK